MTHPWRTIAILWGAAIAVMAVTVALSAGLDRDVAFFTRDPVAAVQDGVCSTECFYAGLVSNIGVLALAFGCAFATQAAIVVRARAGSGGLLAEGAVLLAVLLVDDLFGVHDHLLPSYVPQGEHLFQAFVALLALAVVVRNRDEIRRSGLAALILATAAGFVVSAAADSGFVESHLLEDGAKLFGIMSLAGFFMAVATSTLTSGTAPRRPAA